MRKRPLLFCILVAAVCMFVIPIALRVVPGNAILGFAFLYLYVMAPVWSAVAGVWASANVQKMWTLPLISAALGLFGCWISFSWGNTDFIILALVYAGIGYAAMGLAWVVHRRREAREQI